MMVLRTLKSQPLHGYALVQHIKRSSNDLLQIEEGSLYRLSSVFSRKGSSKRTGEPPLQIVAFESTS